MEPKWNVVTFEYPSGLTGVGVLSTGHGKAPPQSPHPQQGTSWKCHIAPPANASTAVHSTDSTWFSTTTPQPRSNTTSSPLLRFHRCLYRISNSGTAPANTPNPKLLQHQRRPELQHTQPLTLQTGFPIIRRTRGPSASPGPTTPILVASIANTTATMDDEKAKAEKLAAAKKRVRPLAIHERPSRRRKGLS